MEVAGRSGEEMERRSSEEEGDKFLQRMEEKTVLLQRKRALPARCAWDNFPFNDATVASSLPSESLPSAPLPGIFHGIISIKARP